MIDDDHGIESLPAAIGHDLLRVRDRHGDIRFGRSRGDGAILINTEIDVPQPAG